MVLLSIMVIVALPLPWCPARREPRPSEPHLGSSPATVDISGSPISVGVMGLVIGLAGDIKWT